jgi:preprotein translocase subunit SecF
MLIGLVAGTYSSIFVASQLLVTWDEGDVPRLFGRDRERAAEGTA